MAGMRSYDDSCGIARALDVVGERWALLVVRELVLGPKRFTDLRAALPGVTADVLAQRLRELQAAGLLIRAELPRPAAGKVYALSDRGRQLRPVLRALSDFGTGEPLGDHPAPLSSDAMALALESVGRPDDDGTAVTVELRFGADSILATAIDGAVRVTRGGADVVADVRLDTDTDTLARLLWRGETLSDAIADATVRLGGSRAAAERFLHWFAPAVTPEEPAVSGTAG